MKRVLCTLRFLVYFNSLSGNIDHSTLYITQVRIHTGHASAHFVLEGNIRVYHTKFSKTPTCLLTYRSNTTQRTERVVHVEANSSLLGQAEHSSSGTGSHKSSTRFIRMVLDRRYPRYFGRSQSN